VCSASISEAGSKRELRDQSAMGISELEVRRIFATALLIIRDREKRFLSLVPKHLLANLSISDHVSDIVSGLEKQDKPPYSFDKCFIADLALMATRILEAYSFDKSGHLIAS
jgi:hypothetical protein